MPEAVPPPEELLVGADRPRPLPPGLRSRLEGALLSRPAGTGDVVAGPALDIPVELRRRLEVSLGRPTSARRARALRWSVPAGLVAALALVLGVLSVGGRAQVPTAGKAADGALAPVLAPARQAEPAGRAGAYFVRAPGAASASASRAAGPAQALVALTPGAGPVEGGTVVTLRGTGLAPVDRVLFGAVPGRVLSRSANRLTVQAPAHPAGRVVVSAEVAAGYGSSGYRLVVAGRLYFRYR